MAEANTFVRHPAPPVPRPSFCILHLAFCIPNTEVLPMKSVLSLGAGNFGSMLARQMNMQGFEIMIVDARESLINAVMPYVKRE